MNKFKTLLEKIRSNNINWKSKKTIVAVTVAAAVLFAALTGVTALTVRYLNTEPAQTTLSVAEEVTAAAKTDEVSATTAENAAEAANTAPASTTTPALTAGATNSKTSAESNNSTGSKTNGKTGSSSNSGGASHSSGTNSKPATGSNSSNNSSAKPSGGSTAKPTTTKPVTTTQPAKKEFAMTKQEIIDYASNYIVNTYHCTYYDGFGKDVPGTGYNAPFEFVRGDSAEYIKRNLRGDADATYLPNGWYKVYVEQVDENTMRVYMFYA